jgi:general stress protein YciG
MEMIVLEEKKAKMTVEEAGRRGGLRTSETQGELFLREIGQKGGESGGNRNVTYGTNVHMAQILCHMCINLEKAKFNP